MSEVQIKDPFCYNLFIIIVSQLKYLDLILSYWLSNAVY